jgi:hypothetical protein
MWELVLPEALERHAPLVGSEGDSLPPHQVGVGQGQQGLDKSKRQPLGNSSYLLTERILKFAMY